MFFKNLILYRLEKPFSHSLEELETALGQAAFTPCGPADSSRYGWSTPMPGGQQFVHSGSGYHLIATKKEERILPASVIREHAEQRADEIEASTGARPRGKRLKQLREEVTEALTPRAFTRSRYCYAWIAPQLNTIAVDSATAARADELINFLRQTLGSLPVSLPKPKQPLPEMFTRWLADTRSLPAELILGDECELREPVEQGGIVRCRQQDLEANEILNHVKTGKHASKLALNWKDRLSFVLDDMLSIKRLRFGEDILEAAEATGEGDVAMQFDSDFNLMSLELAAFIPYLLEHTCRSANTQ